MKYFVIYRLKGTDDVKNVGCLYSENFVFLEQAPGCFVLTMLLMDPIASPYPALLSDLMVFSWVGWSISAASQRDWGIQGLAGSGVPFVWDQDCWSARALPSAHNELEIPQSSQKTGNSSTRKSY